MRRDPEADDAATFGRLRGAARARVGVAVNGRAVPRHRRDRAVPPSSWDDPADAVAPYRYEPRHRGRRPVRSRRLEWAISAAAVAIVAALAWAWSARWTAAAAAVPAPVPTPRLSPTAEPTAIPTATPVPPIAFSFTRFEADPAVVAGAASTGVPSISGEAGIVVDLGGTEVLYAKQARKRLLIASTTKIMTAMVAVDRSPLDRVVTISARAATMEPNKMGLKEGEQLTVEELLYGMMLDSGNDAAEAIAEGVGGGGDAGRQRFVGWMNEKARALGLADTSFANPSGLDDLKQYSTAYDLSVMGASLLAYPQLRAIVGTRSKVIESSKQAGHVHGWFGPANVNGLLGSYAGAIGIKPGYTEDAGYTLVGAAERNGRTLVCVSLNSRLHVTDCARLLDFGFKRAADLAKSATSAPTIAPSPTSRP